MPGVQHKFLRAKADDADTTLIRPVNWNDEHGNIEWKVVTADITKSNVTLADITGLTFSIDASTTYLIEAYIFWLAAATTTGLSLALNGPASPTNVIYSAIIPTAATAIQAGGATAYETKITGTASLTTTLGATFSGQVVNGTTAGTLAMRWSPEVVASATIKRGSWARVVKI